ncbi:unnamed protein product [Rotaria socialis]|uniref:Uncharacterized protein n=1 Tax=Rotaria socialis TaxID=392032 RepID=A0A817V8Q5_9BILA|nr:unnamed protein product [Rotaria socialis]CAF3357015.1 unnamed protein product [Rotaria socialis]CAF3427041.1 unnamed protein product [Rotaria socialis]CAF4424132.1 unnamed protein product [Rotaria socialis]CAF4561996.1 unnamed protein product [Rotaria socialis]
MVLEKKKQIRGIRILLTIFYGFLLSSTLFRYVIHGIVETVRRPTDPFAIALIVIGGIILISIFLATYATWFDNAAILMVSGIVFILVFGLTLVFGILRIVKTAPQNIATTTAAPKISVPTDDSINDASTQINNDNNSNTYIYALTEDITKLVIELIFTLFAILGTFTLMRYIKAKYAPVPTR